MYGPHWVVFAGSPARLVDTGLSLQEARDRAAALSAEPSTEHHAWIEYERTAATPPPRVWFANGRQTSSTIVGSTPTKPRRGGFRPGAGRKPTSPQPFVRQVVFVLPEHADVLRDLGDGNLSAGLRRVLDEQFPVTGSSANRY